MSYQGHPATLNPINGKMLSDLLRTKPRMETIPALVENSEVIGREAFRAGLPCLPVGLHPSAGLAGSQAFVIGWYAA